VATTVQASRALERIDAHAFSAARFTEHTPAIIVGAMDEWPAMGKWSPDYLASVLQDREVRIAVSKSHKYDYNPATSAFENLTQFRKEAMGFAAFVEKIHNAAAAGEHYYLMQRPIQNDFPELVPDVVRPRWIQDKKKVDVNLWVGSAGNVTQMHYDRDENFLAEVQGSKHIRLFDPEQTELLYPYPKDSVMYYLSYVDCDNPDYEKFPKFREARAWEGVLNPGEILYLPARWWHQVRSLQDAISVNFWWAPAKAA
jgi:ribosomal protein L16 Arg81 hydroxylase